MNVLGAIRKASIVVSGCSWLATIITALGAAMAPPGNHGGGALAAEILFGSIAATATLVFVVAALVTHIDDTQWNVGYAERIVQQSLADGPEGTQQAARDNIVPLRSPQHRRQPENRPHTGT